MAPILLKRVVSVSSEDVNNPASNLLASASGGRWLCSSENKSRTAEVVLDLCKRIRISSLELCNSGSAFVEVLVSDSENPETFVTLLHMSMLMTVQEARTGRNKSKVFSYGRDKLSSAVSVKKWNRVKIQCVQKYNRDDQFGLRSISVFSESHNTSDSLLLSPSAQHNAKTYSSLTPDQALMRKNMEQSRDHHLKIPSSSDPLYGSSRHPIATQSQAISPMSTTPKKRPLHSLNKKADGAAEKEEFEFSGVESQSRLLHHCLNRGSERDRASDDSFKPNKILDKISSEKEKYRDVVNRLRYPRKKLLKAELPKSDTMRDFVDSYRDKEKSNSTVCGAFRKMSSHDNDYEIGEEPETMWGWNRFKGKSKKRSKTVAQSAEVSGWINKRKKLTGMIGQCSDIIKRTGHSKSVGGVVEKEDIAEKHKDNLENDCETEPELDGDSSDDTIIYSPSKNSTNVSPSDTTKTSTSYVECPLCLAFYPHYAIELHASQCAGDKAHDELTVENNPILID